MRIVPFLIIVAFLTVSIAAISSLQAKDDSEWYPFYFPEKLDPNSPLNIGKLVLDPPAGKHGFVKVKDGHFYFEDGTRAKFWGTNLCFSACFPEKKYAEMLADRIAYFGFNAVRLHHMDWGFEPRGIFKDVVPAFKNVQLKPTGVLSEAQLDKLDYLVYQLKQRGIYIDMNLLVSHHYSEADGVVDAEKLGMAAKPYSMFDPKLIALQKQYAKDLLTHYNPYTKLRYCDDPGIALVEIINEASINRANKSKMPKYYREQLDSMSKLSYDDIEKKYFDDMVMFLKTSIGVKCPIGGSQYSSAYALSSCDFIDKHAYWDHPKFPRKQWDRNDFTITNKSILRDRNLGIMGHLKKFDPEDKPYIVSEWNHCYPNQYAYEMPTILAAEAVKNDWDALFQFAFSHGWSENPSIDSINSYFDTIANAQKLILAGFGSLIFLKEKDVSLNINDGVAIIRSERLTCAVGFIKNKSVMVAKESVNPISDGAIIFLSDKNGMSLFECGEIKNTGSKWDKKFDWGTAPTIMRKVTTRP